MESHSLHSKEPPQMQWDSELNRNWQSWAFCCITQGIPSCRSSNFGPQRAALTQEGAHWAQRIRPGACCKADISMLQGLALHHKTDHHGKSSLKILKKNIKQYIYVIKNI